VGQDISAVDELEDCQDCVDRTYNPIVAQIVNGSTPVIAAVNGACVGAGMGIALACDMVFMAETAFMSCAFSQIALVPDSGASFFLVRALGYHRAFEIATTGRPIPAEECFSLGLTTRFVPPDELAEIANAHALAIANGAKEAIFLTRQLLRKGLSEPFEDILVAEAKAQGLAGRTAEHIDRRTAFLASRSSK
jgi:2-(1,2-epoxy-1,2-dihydrophenyl)acetyl-CoA isomerase